MRQETNSSRLFYHGTQEEVRLGDRVRMKRFLRGPLDGVVCYIPGISAKHGEMEDDFSGTRQWAIRANNGSVYPIVYDPEHFQPPKNISLRERGSGREMTPDEHLE